MVSSSSSKDLFLSNFTEEIIREVTENHIFNHTARGVDGESYDVFSRNLNQTISLINIKSLSGSYRFSPYREKLILKSADTPPRKVSIPTIRDRVTLRCLNNFLCQIFSDCKPQHAHPVVSKAIETFNVAQPNDSFIKLDVQAFYDQINHKILETQLRKRIKHDHAISIILKAITTPTGVSVKDNKKNSIGIPQGLSISNILASIYMLDIDLLYESRLDLSYHRYVDDILLRTRSDEADVVAEQIRKKLKRTRKLSIHPLGSGKSAIYSFDKPVSYLGYKFKGKLISVREPSVKKMMSSVMRIIAGINDENAERSIWRLNIRISGCRILSDNVGWLFYFSQINDRKLLLRIDNQIKSRLKKINRPYLYDRCKNFIKAHREIKYNSNNSSYIFDFDLFSRSQMLDSIYLIKPSTYGKFDSKSDDEIRSIFFRTMYREAKEMERDTLGSFS